MTSTATFSDPRGSALLADRILCVIPCASERWVTLKNYDLVVQRDRLVSSRGPRIRDVYADAELDRFVYGEAGDFAETQERMLEHGRQRAAALADTSDAEILARDASNKVIPIGSIRSATVRRRLRVLRLRCELYSGEIVQWLWLQRQGAPDEVLPALRDVLGHRLSAP